MFWEKTKYFELLSAECFTMHDKRQCRCILWSALADAYDGQIYAVSICKRQIFTSFGQVVNGVVQGYSFCPDLINRIGCEILIPYFST